MTRTFADPFVQTDASRLPGPCTVALAWAISVKATEPVPTKADRSVPEAAESRTELVALALWDPKSWLSAPDPSALPSKPPTGALCCRVGLVVRVAPAACTARLPLTWALIVCASGSLFSTWTSDVTVPCCTICTAVSVPSAGLNWATFCVCVKLVCAGAKVMSYSWDCVGPAGMEDGGSLLSFEEEDAIGTAALGSWEGGSAWGVEGAAGGGSAWVELLSGTVTEAGCVVAALLRLLAAGGVIRP